MRCIAKVPNIDHPHCNADDCNDLAEQSAELIKLLLERRGSLL